jgi:hypothetical protein
MSAIDGPGEQDVVRAGETLQSFSALVFGKDDFAEAFARSAMSDVTTPRREYVRLASGAVVPSAVVQQPELRVRHSGRPLYRPVLLHLGR